MNAQTEFQNCISNIQLLKQSLDMLYKDKTGRLIRGKYKGRRAFVFRVFLDINYTTEMEKAVCFHVGIERYDNRPGHIDDWTNSHIRLGDIEFD